MIATVRRIANFQLAYYEFSISSYEGALEDSPAVFLYGPRQCGKTTLAKMVGELHSYGLSGVERIVYPRP